MVTIADERRDLTGFFLRHISIANERWIILTVGAILSLFAVGGIWDIPLFAWVAPVLLLRFSRTTSFVVGASLIWLVGLADSLSYSLQVDSPVMVINLAVATAITIPYALDRLLVARLGRFGSWFLFPAVCVTMEFAMASSPLSDAFDMRAITQTENIALLQVLSLAGPYSIAFLIGWFATTTNLVWENASIRKVALTTSIFGATLVAVLLFGEGRLAFAPNPTSYVNIAGITPNRHVQDAAKASFGSSFPTSAEQFRKANPARLQAAYNMVLDDLFVSTRQAANAGAKIVMWSETAARVTPESRPAVLARAAKVAREEHIYLNVALGQPFARNETYLISPNGQVLWHYEKTHPVPFMEPHPPGHTPVPTVETPYGRLTNIICFDADFPSLARVAADIMLVPGADWPAIGRTHTLKMARLRVIENGYSMVRMPTASQGAAFDRYGRVLVTQNTISPDRHIMYAHVPTKGSRTIYNRVGDILAWLCIAGVLAAIGLAFVSKRRAR